MVVGVVGVLVVMIINYEGVLDDYGNGCRDGKIIVFCGYVEVVVVFIFLLFFCVVVFLFFGVYSLVFYFIF